MPKKCPLLYLEIREVDVRIRVCDVIDMPVESFVSEMIDRSNIYRSRYFEQRLIHRVLDFVS